MAIFALRMTLNLQTNLHLPIYGPAPTRICSSLTFRIATTLPVGEETRSTPNVQPSLSNGRADLRTDDTNDSYNKKGLF